MNEKDAKSWQICCDFYRKWRETVIETDEQWGQFSEDVGRLGQALDIDNNPLGFRLMCAVLETFNDLYKDGMKPMPANYFGRDDL